MEMSILYAIQQLHTPLLTTLMIMLTNIGNGGAVWAVIAISCLFFTKSRPAGIAILVALVLSFIVGNEILKNLVMRSRPCWIDPSVPLLIHVPKDYSFPSGHTFSAFAAASALYFSHRRLGIWALILAALIGFSRLYLFVHFPTDVLAGAFLGLGAGYAAYRLVQFAYSAKEALPQEDDSEQKIGYNDEGSK